MRIALDRPASAELVSAGSRVEALQRGSPDRKVSTLPEKSMSENSSCGSVSQHLHHITGNATGYRTNRLIGSCT